MKAVIYCGVLSLMSQKCYKASEFDARKPKPTQSLHQRKQIWIKEEKEKVSKVTFYASELLQ